MTVTKFICKRDKQMVNCLMSIRCCMCTPHSLPQCDAFLASRSDHHRKHHKPLTQVQRHPCQQHPRCGTLVLRAHFPVFTSPISGPLRHSSGSQCVGLWSAHQRWMLQLHPFPAAHHQSLSSASQVQHVEPGFAR